MRALPLTNKSKPGGRPRRSRAPDNPFKLWLQSCDLTPEKVAADLKVSPSSIYNARNGYFKPGRSLAVKIEEYTRNPDTGVSAVPASSWDAFKGRPRSSSRTSGRKAT